jgi:hypothetical protein
MARATREIWAKRVERWAESGLTAAEFAGEADINARTLTFWKWRLGRGSASKQPQKRTKFVEIRAQPPGAIVRTRRADPVLLGSVVLRPMLIG